MQPKALVVTKPAVQPAMRTTLQALKITVLVCGAFVAALLVAELEAMSYQPGAARADAELVYQTIAVSP
jgi:hypothetical protein